MLTASNLRAVEVDDDLPTFGAVPDPEREAKLAERERRATEGLLLAIGALSKRFVIALASLFDLLLIGSVFTLACMVIPQPNPLQLTGVGGYALFVLAAIFLRMRRASR